MLKENAYKLLHAQYKKYAILQYAQYKKQGHWPNE